MDGWLVSLFISLCDTISTGSYFCCQLSLGTNSVSMSLRAKFYRVALIEFWILYWVKKIQQNFIKSICMKQEVENKHNIQTKHIPLHCRLENQYNYRN